MKTGDHHSDLAYLFDKELAKRLEIREVNPHAYLEEAVASGNRLQFSSA